MQQLGGGFGHPIKLNWMAVKQYYVVSGQHELVIGTLRLPRIILAILVGASLGVAGSILQGMIRNPLASPDIIGVTGGGTLAAVAFITYFAGTVSIHWMPVAAFVGAAIMSLIIYLLAWTEVLRQQGLS